MKLLCYLVLGLVVGSALSLVAIALVCQTTGGAGTTPSVEHGLYIQQHGDFKQRTVIVVTENGVTTIQQNYAIPMYNNDYDDGNKTGVIIALLALLILVCVGAAVALSAMRSLYD